jgi:D-alanyl-lipoteichoic acid acyltransferase DltB (MBOAT superfamily)
MSLSRFLRDYIYIPLGGNRKGEARRYTNLFLTMLLAGIWHGAGWTFIIWGALHGVYLVVNHLYQKFAQRIQHNPFNSPVGKGFSLLITFLIVAVSWVIFRADNLDTALSILYSMTGQNGISTDAAAINQLVEWKGAKDLLIISFLVVWLLPNTYDFMRNYQPILQPTQNRSWIRLFWSPVTMWSMVIAILALASLVSMYSLEKTEFLYFNF